MSGRSDSRQALAQTRRFNRRGLVGAAAAGGAAVMVSAVACSAGRPRSATSKSASGGSASTAGQPRATGTLRVPVADDPFDWDSSYAGKSNPNGFGIVMAQESLLTFKTGPGVAYADLILQPRLAEKWEVSPDATTFTFHLRRGVQFAGIPPVNEREVTSADVKFSYEYASRGGSFKDKKLPTGFFAFMFEGMQQIETPDPYTAVVRFQSPFVPFLNYAASDQNPIVPHEIYDQDGNFKNRVVGTGPYQLDLAASQKGTRWVWKRNGHYWQAGRPFIDEVDWFVLRDDATAQSAFQAKQIDWINALDGNAAAAIRRNNPAAVVNEYPNPSPVHLYMQAARPPFNDLRIRRALALTIDRDEYLRSFSLGKGGWALAGAFPDTFSQEEAKQMLRPDVATARALVRAAGYADGLDIEFLINPSYGQAHVKQAELMQAQAKPAGINLVIKPIDNSDYATRKRDRKFTLMHTNKALQSEVDSYVYSAFYPGVERNYTGVDDPALTSLLVAQRRETDPAKRREIVRQAVRRINTEQYWAVALYYDVGTEFWQPALKGYSPSFGNQTASTDPPGWSVDSWLDR